MAQNLRPLQDMTNRRWLMILVPLCAMMMAALFNQAQNRLTLIN